MASSAPWFSIELATEQRNRVGGECHTARHQRLATKASMKVDCGLDAQTCTAVRGPGPLELLVNGLMCAADGCPVAAGELVSRVVVTTLRLFSRFLSASPSGIHGVVSQHPHLIGIGFHRRLKTLPIGRAQIR
jgi:hypothetical protein